MARRQDNGVEIHRESRPNGGTLAASLAEQYLRLGPRKETALGGEQAVVGTWRAPERSYRGKVHGNRVTVHKASRVYHVLLFAFADNPLTGIP